MTTVSAPPHADWVASEMPPGYHNRLAEIERLSADLRGMEKFGRLLHQVGTPLSDAVGDLFTALNFEIGRVQASATSLVVRLGGSRRLLLQISETSGPIERRSGELAHAFRLLHEVAEEADRVVLVTNAYPENAPADRGAAVTPEATAFLARMGASHVSALTLFALWKLSLESPDRARAQVERLHEQNGGTFEVPPSR